MAEGSALVLFSGGQDSTVCLAWALDRYAHVETVGFAYGQRHAVELTQRPVIRAEIAAKFPQWAPRLGDDHLLELSTLGQISDTALTRDVQFEMTAAGLPNTFVPGRNLLFFTYAAALAYRRGIRTPRRRHVRDGFLRLPRLPQRDPAEPRQIHLARHGRALHHRNPADVDRQGRHLGDGRTPRRRLPWSISSSTHTHTCYTPDRTTRHAWGVGCGTCPACSLRAKGWDQWQIAKN